MFIPVSAVQFSKVLFSMIVKFWGNLTVVRFTQSENVFSSILVTVLGISMDMSPLHPLNARSTMAVTPLGTKLFLQPAISSLVAVSMIALQFSRLSYVGLPSSTMMLSSPLHSANAPFLIVVILLGILMLVSPVQPLNIYNPMFVHLSGTVKFVSPVQSRNVYPPVKFNLSLFGSSILVSPVHPANAAYLMVVTLFGTLMLVSPVHSQNACSQMVVRPSGSSMLVSPAHFQNAKLHISVVPSFTLIVVFSGIVPL